MNNQDKGKLIKDLEAKIAQKDHDLKRLRQLELKLANYDRDAQRIA